MRQFYFRHAKPGRRFTRIMLTVLNMAAHSTSCVFRIRRVMVYPATAWLLTLIAGCVNSSTPSDAVDAGDPYQRKQARNACYASCDAQHKDCSTLSLTDCRGLCDYVLAGVDSAACLTRLMDGWECDVTQSWHCDPEQNVVAAPVDTSTCKAQRAALCDAGTSN